jgi:hypothetical protein
MTTEFPPRVPGHTVHERAVALAGLLSEFGVQRVELRGGGESSSHAARVTDLPGLLAARVPCHVHGFAGNGDAATVVYSFTADGASRITMQ